MWHDEERDLQRAAISLADSGGAVRIDIDSLPDVTAIAGAEVAWLIDGLIPENTSVLVTGESGCGKSTLVTAICGHVSSGVPFLGRETQRRRVLYLDRENPAGVVAERLHRLCMASGPDFKFWGLWCAEEPCSPGGALVQEWAAANPGALVVVDSALSFLEGDENSASEVKAFCSELRRLTALGATVITLHHSSEKAAGSKYRGSSYWKGGVDVALHMVSSNPARLERIDLEPFKSRVIVDRLALKFDSFSGEFHCLDGETQSDRLRELLRRNPGVGTREFENIAAEAGLGRNAARGWLDRSVESGLVVATTGVRNRRFHSLAEGP
jgi:hypothetical protein